MKTSWIHRVVASLLFLGCSEVEAAEPVDREGAERVDAKAVEVDPSSVFVEEVTRGGT